MTLSSALQNGIASLIILVPAVAFVVYNRWFANKFADQFLSVTGWAVPRVYRPRLRDLYFIGYRMFFYVSSLFFALGITLYLIALFSNYL